MKFKLTLCICSLMLLSLPIFISGQNKLTVGDPRQSTYTQTATIEEALLSVRNKGLYLEYGLYLTFSARGTNYKASDSLEVVLNFTLPAKSIVTDSWLWINEDICKAKILDIWSASNIYENIVKRRRDPSLLIKNGDNAYTLRVFPMGGNEQRRVKITYLVPLNWFANKVSAQLPAYILNTSKYIPSQFPLIIWSDSDWKNPVIENAVAQGVVDVVDPVLGNYRNLAMFSSGNYPSMNIAFDNPMKNGIYMAQYPGSLESYYQIAVQPSSFTDQIKNRKIAFLLDYQQQTNVIDKQDFLNQVKTEIKNSLSDLDSFNVFFSNLTIQQASSNWIPATDEQIELAFNNAINKLVSFSNLPTLLSAGIQFVNQQNAEGSIMLFNNSDQFITYQAANEVIEIIRQQNIHSIQLNILDYNNNNKNTLINGRTYYNNEYLFINLSNLSGGFYSTTRFNQPFAKILTDLFTQSSPAIKGFDLYLRIQQGITYGKYPLVNFTDNIPVHSIFTQTGLFRGQFPFTVEMSGELNRDIFSANYEVGESEIEKIDSSGKTGWTAQGIFKLESQASNNANIQDIIYKSIENRILSKYTAFLCIEDSTLYCHTCFDDTEIFTSTEDEQQDSLSKLVAFPNPFDDQLTIELHDITAQDSKWLGEITDLTGTTIHQFKIDREFKDGILQYTWNGKSDSGLDVSPGTYILILHSKERRLYQKVLKF